MEETILVENNKSHPSDVNKPTMKVGIVIGGLLILGATFYCGFMFGKSVHTTPPNNSASQINKSSQNDLQPTQQPVNQVATINDSSQMMRIYSSPNNNYSFYVYSTSDSEKCLYGIRNKQGYGYDVSGVLGTDKITCTDNQGSLSTSFVSWTDGAKFVINEKEGVIDIVNVEKFEADTYNYDSANYSFVGVSHTLQYWLFRKNNQVNSTSYVLFDKDNHIVLDNISINSNDRGVLYDEVNDGFLFISRTFTGEDVSVKFEFLSNSNLSLRTLLTTDPVVAPGRGCSSEYLLSQPGEIILTPGCLTVANKYLGSDGNIHIKL